MFRPVGSGFGDSDGDGYGYDYGDGGGYGYGDGYGDGQSVEQLTYINEWESAMKKPKPELTRAQAWGWQDLMVICAFRYCLGRRTYIVGACADWLIDIWPLLKEATRTVIECDLDREFELDDAARERGDYKPLGDDCDREEWERVRALWINKGDDNGSRSES